MSNVTQRTQRRVRLACLRGRPWARLAVVTRLSPVLIKCDYILLYNFLKMYYTDMKYSEYM